MCRRGGNVPVGPGNRPKIHLHRRPSLLRFAEITLDRPGVVPVGCGSPRMVRLNVTAVHVVPAGVDDHPVVIDAGLPLVGLVVAEPNDAGAVGVHGVQREQRHRARVATSIPGSTLRDEQNPAVGEPTGVEIVHRAVGQLHQLRAVEIDLEDVIRASLSPLIAGRLAFRICKQHGLSVVGQLRTNERAGHEPFASEPTILAHRIRQDVSRGRPCAERVLQHEEPPAGNGVEPEKLIAHVIAQQHLARQPMPLDEQDAVEIQQRVGKCDLPPQIEQFPKQDSACLAVAGVDPGRLFFEPVESRLFGRQIGWIAHGFQMRQQGGRAAEDYIGRIAIRRENHRFRPKGLLRDPGPVASIGLRDELLEAGESGLFFSFPGIRRPASCRGGHRSPQCQSRQCQSQDRWAPHGLLPAWIRVPRQPIGANLNPRCGTWQAAVHAKPQAAGGTRKPTGGHPWVRVLDD